jgi:TnpA family transposase
MPKGFGVLSSIVPVAISSIALDVIRGNYDESVRVAASIHNGRCTAVPALQRFGSEVRSEPVHAGGVALGRLLRTDFMIDYLIVIDQRSNGLEHPEYAASRRPDRREDWRGVSSRRFAKDCADSFGRH